MPLLARLHASLAAHATRPALEFLQPDGSLARYTFGELDALGHRYARVFAESGFRPGDRVALFLPNRPEFIALWLAAMRLHLIAVPINVLYRERELRHILGDATPRAIVTTPELEKFLPPNLPVWRIDDLAQLARRASSHPVEPRAESSATPLALIYTSGTTGLAKGAILTHGNFLANGAELARAWRFTPDDRLLCTLPLFHVHGLANAVHCWLLSGCHLRLTERFDHTHAAAWFEDYQPTVFFGVPAMFVRLLELAPADARRIGARLRLAVSGSAPLPAEVHAQFRDLYGSVILERYGMTETLMNVGNPYDGERRPGTVGLPFAHVSVEIRDEAGAVVAPGVTGELWVRGPNVCAGYWNRPEATVAAWRDGWFRTGDIGERAPDGYITLKGRRSDLIISGGFNIYPREIEEEILTQPGVREAAVVGVPDTVRGEIPVAYVVASADFDEARTAAHLRAQLASFKQPRAFVRVDALPRTALGKVQKHLLPPWKP